MGRQKTVNEYIIDGDLAVILCIRKDGSTLSVAIDAEDVQKARLHKWCVGVRPDGYRQVLTSAWEPGIGQQTIVLVRYLLGAPEGFQVDHVDRDTLNCRRSNLRIATQSQNRQNLSPAGMGSLETRGVTLDRGRYLARVTLNGSIYRLGKFADLESARKVVSAYRAAYMPFSSDAVKRPNERTAQEGETQCRK